MKLIFIIFVAFLCNQFCFSQNKKISYYEKRWAFFHPFAAIKVFCIQKKCFQIYNQPSLKNKLDSFSNGGKLDAFRHVFFMAAFSQKIKTKKIRKLGIAHEKNNYNQFLKNKYEDGETPDSISTVMDLKNNEVGFVIGKKYKKHSLIELKEKIILEINFGNAFKMKRNKNGTYLDCDLNVINFISIKDKWNVNKCLVKSNE